MTKSEQKPPRAAAALLRRCSPGYRRESAEGDYEEIFSELADRRGLQHARLWYWGQALQSLIPAFLWRGIMLRNYLKVTWRQFIRHKGYSVINITGLALGITCCILIILWIQDETSWDGFHANRNHLYRIVQKQPNGHLTSVTPNALSGYLKREYPEVVQTVRYRHTGKFQIRHDKTSLSTQSIATDPSFFSMFTFPFLEGNKESALNDPHSIILTRGMAQKLFEDREALGKTVLINNRSEMTVTGIVEDPPIQSSIQFQSIIPLQLITQGQYDNNWKSSSAWTFVRLAENIDPKDFDSKIGGLVKNHDSQNNAVLILQPLTHIHLRPQGSAGPILYIYIFAAMAVFVLLTACFNFINLTTARAATRAKEVGMRKVIGAGRGSLIRQFLSESYLFVSAAALLSLLLVALFIPAFNRLSVKSFSFFSDVAGNPRLILCIAGIILLTGALSGLYPALSLSKFQPVTALKNLPKTGKNQIPLLRRILVILQFSLSVFLLIGTLVVYKQLRFIQNRALGFNVSNIIVSDSNWGSVDPQSLKRELLKHPNIENMTFANQKMGEWESGAREDVKWEGRKDDLKITFELIFCDPDYMETHQLELTEGRFLSYEFPADKTKSFVLNESAVKAMGFFSQSPVGESLAFWDQYSGTIIGIVKDFHTQSLHNAIQPVILAFSPDMFDMTTIRIRPEAMSSTIRFIENKWKEMTNGIQFDYRFLDESLNDRYRTEMATGTLLRYFTFLAVFISGIGLLGLVSFICRQRTKEIGIRKVLGASGTGIIFLFMKEFMILVALSNGLAWPVAFIVSRSWLSHFAYRTAVGWDVFFLSAGLAVTVAFLTVFIQVFSTVRANPIHALRCE